MLSKGLFFFPGLSGASMKCSLCYTPAPQEKGNNPTAVFQTIDILAMTSFAIKITNCVNAFYNSPLFKKVFVRKCLVDFVLRKSYTLLIVEAVCNWTEHPKYSQQLIPRVFLPLKSPCFIPLYSLRKIFKHSIERHVL